MAFLCPPPFPIFLPATLLNQVALVCLSQVPDAAKKDENADKTKDKNADKNLLQARILIPVNCLENPQVVLLLLRPNLLLEKLPTLMYLQNKVQ